MRAACLLLLIALGLAGCNAVKGTHASGEAVTQIHAQLDAGEFAAIYAAAHPELKTASSQATETFTFRVMDEKAQLLGYNITSNALITK